MTINEIFMVGSTLALLAAQIALFIYRPALPGRVSTYAAVIIGFAQAALLLYSAFQFANSKAAMIGQGFTAGGLFGIAAAVVFSEIAITRKETRNEHAHQDRVQR